MMLTPAHAQSIDQLIADLKEIVPELMEGTSEGETPNFRYS